MNIFSSIIMRTMLFLLLCVYLNNLAAASVSQTIYYAEAHLNAIGIHPLRIQAKFTQQNRTSPVRVNIRTQYLPKGYHPIAILQSEQIISGPLLYGSFFNAKSNRHVKANRCYPSSSRLSGNLGDIYISNPNIRTEIDVDSSLISLHPSSDASIIGRVLVIYSAHSKCSKTVQLRRQTIVAHGPIVIANPYTNAKNAAGSYLFLESVLGDTACYCVNSTSNYKNITGFAIFYPSSSSSLQGFVRFEWHNHAMAMATGVTLTNGIPGHSYSMSFLEYGSRSLSSPQVGKILYQSFGVVVVADKDGKLHLDTSFNVTTPPINVLTGKKSLLGRTVALTDMTTKKHSYAPIGIANGTVDWTAAWTYY